MNGLGVPQQHVALRQERSADLQLGVGEVEAIHGHVRDPMLTLDRGDPREQQLDQRRLPRARVARNAENCVMMLFLFLSEG